MLLFVSAINQDEFAIFATSYPPLHSIPYGAYVTLFLNHVYMVFGALELGFNTETFGIRIDPFVPLNTAALLL